MVGSSFVAPFVGTNGRAFRYVHGEPTGSASAIPLLDGGTWSRAMAVSADGNLVLAAGDTPHLPNGEVYLYNATTGATTALGSPNTPWTPGFGGLTTDGSVVVASFISNSRTGRHAYLRNAQGWFHLASALAARGVDIWADGWMIEGMQITGISSDGTVVFGQGVHNDNLEGFVATFPPGYLAAFDFPAVPPSDTRIVGVWTGADDEPSAVAFLADGTYFLIDGRHGSAPFGEFTSGFERGRYLWDGTTGAASRATLQDTNGSVGFSGGNGILGVAMVVSGDTLTMGGVLSLTRATTVPESIVGGWVAGDPRIDNSSTVLILLADGTFLLARDGDSAVDPSGHDGLEAGTYVWGADGALMVTVTVDTNGAWGFVDGPGSATVTMRLSPDGRHLGPPGTPNQFTRIAELPAAPVDVTPPTATAPAPVSVHATEPTGATQALLPALTTFLQGATAIDDGPAAPVQQPPQLNGTAITAGTVFPLGVNAVTFVFADAAGNIGTATSTVTVAGGEPSLSVNLVGMTLGGVGQQVATLRVGNDGTGNALNLNIALEGLRTVVGTGSATLAGGLPLNLPILGPTRSIDVPIVLNVPSTVQRLVLSERLTMRDYTGAVLSRAGTQTIVPIDTTGPRIVMGPTATFTSTTITISWTTDEGATEKVDYGIGTTINRFVPEDSVHKTNHRVTIKGLNPNTTYSYIVSGRDAAGNRYASSRRTVRTAP
jgi:hypothetical protein